MAFRGRDTAQHGHLPYDRERRSIQLNWVVDDAAAQKRKRQLCVSSLHKGFPGRRKASSLTAGDSRIRDSWVSPAAQLRSLGRNRNR